MDSHHQFPLSKWACPELHSRGRPSLPPKVTLRTPEVLEPVVGSTCSQGVRRHSEVGGVGWGDREELWVENTHTRTHTHTRADIHTDTWTHGHMDTWTHGHMDTHRHSALTQVW